MTYKELKEKLNELTEDQLNQEIMVEQEDMPMMLLTGFFITDEDYIYNKEYPDHGCFPVSELDDSEDISDYKIGIKAGTPTLFIQ